MSDLRKGIDMKALFITTAVLVAFLGVAWFAAPATMLGLWGVAGDEVTLYMSRRYGALFFGYFAILLLARNSPPSAARDAIVGGGLVVTSAMAVVSLYGVVTRTVGPGAWSAVVIEVVLACWFGWAFASSRRRLPAADAAARIRHE